MYKIKLSYLFAIVFCSISFNSFALTGISGKFDVDFGPIPLGDVIMVSHCDENSCQYDTQVNGSFLMIGADIHETGTYKQEGAQITPVSTSYIEKVGRKSKEYIYDFVEKQIEDKKKKKTIAMPENALSFVPLLNQVALDIKHGKLKETYDYLSKQKVKQAKISAYMKKPAKGEAGTLHSFVATRKKTKVTITFIEKGDEMFLKGMKYKAFIMSRQR